MAAISTLTSLGVCQMGQQGRLQHVGSGQHLEQGGQGAMDVIMKSFGLA
jgi:hypothetical protein